jgi:hypothetical protein
MSGIAAVAIARAGARGHKRVMQSRITSTMMSLALAATLAAGCHHGPSDHGPSGHHAPAPHEALTEAVIAVPIRADRTAAWEAALHELVGPRYEEYRASRTRFGLTSQTTFLQHTPMGDLALIHLTGPDIHRAFHAMSSSREPWDVKWREMTLDLHGIDFTQGTRVMPAITKAFEMASGDVAGTSPFLFAVPIDPQRIADVRALVAELTGPRRAEYVRSRERIGVRRELAFLETTGTGAALVFYWRAADPQASMRRLVDSTEPFDRWLAEVVAPLHPVPLATLVGTVSANRLIAQYPKPGRD